MQGDGQGQEHRRIRVLDRSGTLYSLSQDMPGLQWTMAWRPSGSVIAAPVSKPGNKQVVAFFEKNGLEHGGFEIDKDVLVKSLDWSPDSNVLCVSIEGKENQNEEELCVLIFFALTN